MQAKVSKRYVVSRKLIIWCSIIAIPVILLCIYIINGFVANKITPELNEKLGYSEGGTMTIVSKDKITDFTFTPTIDKIVKSKDYTTYYFKYEYKNDKDGTASSISTKIVAGDYWANYVSDASSKERTTINTSSDSLNFKVSNTNKNGWGVNVNVSSKPTFYIRLSYTYVDYAENKSKKDMVVKYDYNDCYTNTSVIEINDSTN